MNKLIWAVCILAALYLAFQIGRVYGINKGGDKNGKI